MEKTEVRQIIERTAYSALGKIAADSYVKLYYVFYPIPGFANHVRDEVVFYTHERRIVAQVVREWDGNGMVYADFILPEGEFIELLRAARGVENINDFKRLTTRILEAHIRIENKIAEAMRMFVDEVIALQADARLLELLQDKKRVLEILQREINNC